MKKTGKKHHKIRFHKVKLFSTFTTSSYFCVNKVVFNYDYNFTYACLLLY